MKSMNTQLYILGLLNRYGPQHGYLIEKRLRDQVEDFAYVKHSTLYYHLKKLAADGLVEGESHESGNQSRTVYSLMPAGRDRLEQLLETALHTYYAPVFTIDAALYFADQLTPAQFVDRFDAQIAQLDEQLDALREHRRETLDALDPSSRPVARILFSHHAKHLKAERRWVVKARAVFAE